MKHAIAAQPLDQIAPNGLDRLVAELMLLGSVFMAGLLCSGWLGLWFGISVTSWHLPVVALGVVVLARQRRGSAAVALLILILAFGVSVLGARAMFDGSWDGMVYHQLAIVAFRDGWNPTVDPHLLDWLTKQTNVPAFVVQALGDDSLAGDSIWSNHFPKGAWVMASIVAKATGSLDSGKAFQLFLPCVAAACLWRGLRTAKLTHAMSAICALAALASPVAIVQLGTNYVDGLLASALVMLIGASLAWMNERRTIDLVPLVFGVMLAANLKFSGAVYAGMLALMALFVPFAAGWRPNRAQLAVLGAGIGALILVSAQTYGHNVVAHGHPLYPLYPMDTAEIMRDQVASDFYERGRFAKLAASVFQVPSNSQTATPQALVAVPSLEHYRELTLAVDTRFAGFGSLFGWSLLPALACLLLGAVGISRLTTHRSSAVSVLLVIVWALLSMALNPEMWWARYVPQLWLLPVLAAALAWRAGWRRLAWGTVLLALLSAGLTLAFWLPRVQAEAKSVAWVWNRCTRVGNVPVLDVGPRIPGLFVLWAYARERGLTISTVAGADCPERWQVSIGIIEICPPR